MSLALAFASVLASCGPTGPVETYDHYFKPGAHEWISTYAGLRQGKGSMDPFSTVAVETPNGLRTKKMVQNVKALVVPVDFTDFPASGLPNGEEGTKTELEAAVFGEAEETRWHSLRSFYEESSFGQCHVSGEVVDFFHTGVTAREFATGATFGKEHTANGQGFEGTTGTSVTKKLVAAITSLYKEGGSRYGEIDLNEYDANGDDYIDSVLMIYSCSPHQTDNAGKIDDDLFWAFRWNASVEPTYDSYGDVVYPGADGFFWASYRTFYEHEDYTDEDIRNGNATIDCHTLIHEFGHILSLEDYYDYSYNHSPLGALDMMDHNIGDHNAYSKSLLGWITPNIVNGAAEITINSTTDTGDYIILPAPDTWEIWGDYADKSQRWYGTTLAQYLMIEFLTPTGVAYYDGLNQYTPGWAYYFSTAGVRITHVDSRIGEFLYNNNEKAYRFNSYTIQTVYSGTDTGYCDLATTNTGKNNEGRKQEAFEDNRLITTVSSQGITWKARKRASVKNEDLFQEGDTLSGYQFFNKIGGQVVDMGYEISIVKIDGNNSATIRFTPVTAK